MKFNVNINGQNEIEVDQKKLDAAEFISSSENDFAIRYKGKNYNFKLHRIDDNYKALTIEYRGQIYKTSVLDDLDQLIKEMGLDEIHDEFSGEIHSPMPGLVVEILVQEGQIVEKGDDLIILEAMKMENIIKAEGAGIVNKIHIAPLDKVEKSQILISVS